MGIGSKYNLSVGPLVVIEGDVSPFPLFIFFF